MKKIFLSLITAGVILSACNQSSTSTTTGGDSTKTATTVNAADAPIIKFEKESYDFGKIKQGDKVNYNFKFTNNGKSPLIITDAVATCGCTTPLWPHTPIKPGESGEIKVTFNSAGKTGLQDKQITVTANTIPAQSMVHLVGEVIAPQAPATK